MYLIDHMNIHCSSVKQSGWPLHISTCMSDYSTAYHTKLKDNKLCKYNETHTKEVTYRFTINK